MKAVLLGLVLAMPFSAVAANCEIPVTSIDQSVTRVLDQHLGISLSKKKNDELCEKLVKNNAALLLVGGSAISKGKSIAWVHVGLKDRSLGIVTFSYGAFSAGMRDDPSQAAADEMLYGLMSDAVGRANIDQAIQALDVYRQKIKLAYSRPAKSQ